MISLCNLTTIVVQLEGEAGGGFGSGETTIVNITYYNIAVVCL